MSEIKVNVILEFINMLVETKNEVFNHLIYNYEANEEIDYQEFIDIVYQIYEDKRIKKPTVL